MPGGPPAAGGTVVVAALEDVQTWNPYLSEDEFTDEVLSLLYPSLAIEQTDYRLHPPSFTPHLAESWRWSDDHLELTFVLREDAVWSDGVPVSSTDVVFSWQVQTSEDVAWPYVGSKDLIERVEALDEKTVRFVFSEAYPYQMMDANDGPIVPAHQWRSVPFDRWREVSWSERALSAGPVVKSSHTPQQEIVLHRNGRYWKPDAPRLDDLVLRIVPSRSAQLTQLTAGEVDVVDGIPPSAAERVRNHPDLALLIASDRGYSQIRWNLRRPPFDDVRVRRAMSLAIDVDTLIDAVYDTYARRSVGPILSGMWAFNRDLTPPPFDPDQARVLLGEAGWRDTDADGVLDRDGRPLEFELLTNSESDLRQDASVLVEEYLGRIGVRAMPRFVEWGTLLATERRGEFDAILSRWIEPTLVDLNQVWRSPADGEPTFNSGGYSNPEVDHLLDEVDAAPDFAAQKPLFDRIQELIVADQPYTFLVETQRLVGINRRLRGATINDAGLFFNVDEWYVNTAGVISDD